MNKERLLKLANLLEQDAKNPNGIKFDLNWWARPSIDSASQIPYWHDVKREPAPSCDTTGCAMGLAAVSGIFKDEGLSYRISGRNIEVEYRDARGFQYSGFEAAQVFFDINHYQSYQLFNPDHYSSNTKGTEAELEVVRRINQLVETGHITIE